MEQKKDHDSVHGSSDLEGENEVDTNHIEIEMPMKAKAKRMQTQMLHNFLPTIEEDD